MPDFQHQFQEEAIAVRKEDLPAAYFGSGRLLGFHEGKLRGATEGFDEAVKANQRMEKETYPGFICILIGTGAALATALPEAGPYAAAALQILGVAWVCIGMRRLDRG